MSGVNEAYIQARKILLDACEALEDHRHAIILVGAQAIYLHTGDGDLAVAPYTADADLAIDPSLLDTLPPLEMKMASAGFLRTDQPGIWKSHSTVTIDLLVPESLGGIGRRGARLEGHADNSARKVRGLESVLVDREKMQVTSLEETDPRSFEINVAGSGALLIAKLYKIGERKDNPARQKPKDALDVYRLLQAIPITEFVHAFSRLYNDSRSQESAKAAQSLLTELFSAETAPGTLMVAQAIGILDDRDIVIASCTALAQELIEAISTLT